MAVTVTAGIYEVCIGVTNAIAALQYWQQFGYRIEQTGELTAEAATQNITPILVNEFQEPSLSFTAPDGYAWNLLSTA